MMTRDEVLRLLEKNVKASLDLKLLLAIAETESSLDPWDVRFEPNYPYLNTPAIHAARHGISLDTEKHLQKTSWGLFQVMGCAARELGYTDNLTKLLIPDVAIVWGAEFFRVRCKKRYSKVEDQIAAYNAGSATKKENGRYPEKVELYVAKVMKAYQNLAS